MQHDIDYFKGVSNQEINERFKKELYSKTEFVQYNDPDDFFDPEQEYGDHITRCIESENQFIKEIISSSAAQNGVILSGEEIETISRTKREQIYSEAGTLIDDYIEQVSVTYIDPVGECDHKYLMQRWLCKGVKYLRSLIR
ncbi:hypothetical protein [Flavobacterium nitrogenifigens]|uniref:Uncharacterized protein n=1 Tax=Flavobacterium nitrogenifigens TaxID=1617283 RepID=A0A521B3Q1_9FLAO|nr:hypothetical protein [Flavobacterium nitrogenifigens]KAF2334595.1 hypothetical protein DM397_07945 [Flavobacterium nitrogenifigens]SMO41689.1 hypothetical protein SAMN06265220_101649 [Flavobacterium nitrogenifigens]